MYFRMLSNFALRSWLDVPHALIDLSTGSVQALSPLAFQALSFCDGFTNIDALYVLPIHKKIIEKMLQYNIVAPCQKGCELKPTQKHKSFDNEYVETAHWSITGKCNFKCRHCYLSATQAKYGELSTEECLKIIDELASCGIMQVNLTGGEPLIRSDFLELLDALNDKNITVAQIYSNGALVNDKLLDELEKRGMKPEFSISYDGLGWHDWLRGVAGAEKMAIRAFDLLHSRGFPIDVEMCIHKLNKDVLEQSINLLVEHGVKSLKTNPVGNSGEWIKENKKYDLTREELFDLYLDYIPKYLEAGSPLNLHLGGFFYCKKGSKDYSIPACKFDGTEKALSCKLCQHAKHNMYICPDGQLLPCISLGGTDNNFPKTYIFDASLKDLLKSSSYLSLVNYTVEDLCKENKECAKCSYRLTCGGGCRAIACMTEGNYLGCDRASCDIFKKGYIDKIKAAANVNPYVKVFP